MKRINKYKKLFEVENKVNLKTLEKSFQNLVNECHPGKFQDWDAMQEEAEMNGQEIIDIYHFLVSIAPETKEAYTETITNYGTANYHFKDFLLEITFLDGTTYEYFYEYFGVTKPIYIKMDNSKNKGFRQTCDISCVYNYRNPKRILENA